MVVNKDVVHQIADSRSDRGAMGGHELAESGSWWMTSGDPDMWVPTGNNRTRAEIET